MWETERVAWAELTVHSGRAEEIPRRLEAICASTERSDWLLPLSRLKNQVSDSGVPCSATPATVACLLALLQRVSGRKRLHLLAAVNELMAGGTEVGYTPEQRTWHVASVRETLHALHFFVMVCETGDTDEAC